MDYPQLARQARMQGEIIVECAVDPGGRVIHAEVIESASLMHQRPVLLSKAVVENVKQWRFQRLSEGGTAASKIRLRYKFKLENGTTPKSGSRFVFEYPNTVCITAAYASL